MPTLARPEVDVLEGLTTAIIVDQERMGANPRSTVGTATDANAMLRILFSRLGKPHIGPPTAFSFNVPTRTGERGDDRRQGPGERIVVRERRLPGRHVPALRGHGLGQRLRPVRSCTTRPSRSTRARCTIPGYSMDGWYGRIFSGSGFFDMDKPIRKFTKKELHDLLYKEPTKIKVEGINLTYEGVIPKIQKSMLSKDVDSLQPHVRALRGAGGHVHDLPRLRRHPAQQGGPVLEDRREEHRRRLLDADQRPGRLGPGPRRAVGGPAARRAAAPPRLVRRDRAGLPLARPAGGHAVGRRGAAHQDDPPPRLVAHRRHLRLRRAHDRPAPPRHRADERPAAAAAGQGQHRARRGAQARDDRDRRPRRRPRPRRRHGGRQRVLRGHRRGAAGQRHHHRPPSRRPGDAQGRRCVRRPARWRSAARRRTTSRTWTSTSRSGCSAWSPASPAPARAR